MEEGSLVESVRQRGHGRRNDQGENHKFVYQELTHAYLLIKKSSSYWLGLIRTVQASRDAGLVREDCRRVIDRRLEKRGVSKSVGMHDWSSPEYFAPGMRTAVVHAGSSDNQVSPARRRPMFEGKRVSCLFRARD